MSINNLSLTSFKIEMCRENADSDELTILSTATAFFYCFNEEIYLITNWHNVTGRNSLTGKPLDTINLSVPNLMALYLPKRIEAVGNSFYLSWRNVLKLNLYEEDNGEYAPVWFEHPNHENKVDIIAIPVNYTMKTLKENGFAIFPVNSDELNLEDFDIKAGMDAFLIGYPLGMVAGGNLPIWKRGSVASEHDVNIDNLPKYFIDTATTKTGMSGSAVFIKSNGFTLPKGKENIDDMIMSQCYTFGGVYSGRSQLIHSGSNIYPDLAIVWKESAIIEIIEGKHKSKHVYYG